MAGKYRALCLFALAALALLAGPNRPVAAATAVFINEIHYDNAGTDTGEAIEIAGPAGTSLTGWSVVLYNGSTGAAYTTTPLSGTIPDSCDGYGVVVLNYPVNGIQNGSPDGLALVDNGSVVQFLSYEGSFTAAGGPANGLLSADIGVSQGGTGAVGLSLQLSGSGTTYEEFTWNGEAAHTFGACNSGQSFGGGPAAPVINEFVARHAGEDTNEYVELFGSAAAGYSAYTVLEVEGDGAGAGVIDRVRAAGTTDANGLWLTTLTSFENGTLTLLLVKEFSGAAGQDLDSDNDGVLDATPWTEAADSVAVFDGAAGDRTYSPVVLDAAFGGGFTPGGASRIPNGVDTNTAADWLANDFDGAGLPGFTGTPLYGEAFNTPGALNEAVPQPPPVELTIMQIQGAAHLSAYNGERARTTGVVTARAGNGFYLQDPAGDGDPATSDALFVFTSSAPSAAVGDSLAVIGTVSEFYPGGAGSGNLPTTELIGPSLTVLSSGNPLPAATIVGSGGRIPPAANIDDDANGDVTAGGLFEPATDGIDFYESLEAMRLQVNDAIAVGPTNNFGETAVVGDGGAYAGLLTPRGGIVVQSADFNPERIILDDTLVAGGLPRANTGDSYALPIVGVLDYSFGNFKLLPTGPLTLVSGGLVAETTAAAVAGELSIATFNVENLDPRDPAAKFAALASQIVNNLAAPAIISLEEIQDNNGATNDAVVDAGQSYALLIAAIQAAGGPLYDYRDIPPVDDQDGGEPGGNIRVGFLFRPDQVTFVDRPGGSSTNSTAVVAGPSGAQLTYSPGRIDPTNAAFANSRKPLAGEFIFDGQTVIVVANHFNSKGGDGPLFGRIQPPVLASEAQRLLQAAVVNDFAAAALAADANVQLAVVGDMNDFPFSAPLAALAGDELVNLMDGLPENERYSYVFDGNSQTLDNFLVSEALLARLTAFDPVHANAEFAAANRVTDHDPLVGRFCLDVTAPALSVTLSRSRLWPPDHRLIRVDATVTASDNAGAAPAVVLVSVTSDEPDSGLNAEDRPGDIVIVDSDTFRLRAERDDLGDGRIYTITYQATDACGNTTLLSATVAVPHDQR
jgi:hypothetical protein